MGRINNCQSAALDVLDRLLFNQILVFCVYNVRERIWLARIVEGVTRAVGATGATGLHAQCLTHSVLCLLEIHLSDNLDRIRLPGFVMPERPEGWSNEQFLEIQRFHRTAFMALAGAIAEEMHDVPMDQACEIASNLAAAFRHAPASVRFRLTERCLAYAFPEAPLDGLSWLIKAGVIRSRKQIADKLPALAAQPVFARIGLLCEFDMIRNYMGRATGASNIATIALNNSVAKRPEATNEVLLKVQYGIEALTRLESLTNVMHAFIIGKLDEPAYLRDFYKRVSRFCPHMRLTNGTLGKWVGALGAVMVEMERSLHRKQKPLYIDYNNTETITSDVERRLETRGFTVGGRTLYERHSEFSETLFRQVRVYYQLLHSYGAAAPAHLGDYIYYSAIPNTTDL